MQPNIIRARMLALVIVLVTLPACNLSRGASPAATPTPEGPAQIPVAGQVTTPPPTDIPVTSTVAVTPLVTPAAP